MRTRLFCLMSAVLLLSGCVEWEGQGTATMIYESTPESAATVSPSPVEEPTVLELSAEAYPWDKMQPVGIWGTTPMRSEPGYYTVYRDGLWGLITADGRQLLDCVGEWPVDLCDQEEWICNELNTYTLEEHPDAISLREATGKSLCLGHGVNSGRYYYDLDVQQVRGHDVLDGSSSNREVTEREWSLFGDWLPVYPARMKDEYDMGPSEGGWFYINAAGEQLHPRNQAGEEPDAAGWFFTEHLAPVGFDGKWAYTDRSGELVTEAVYDPVWNGRGEEISPTHAACLQNGYAAVCRDGKWGLLDSNGEEVVPCEYAGTAWEGTVLWVKMEDGWHKAELPDAQGTVKEQVTIERDQTAMLYDGSPMPQQTLPLYYRGARDGMTWDEIAQATGFSADELRTLNPNVTEDAEGRLQGVGWEICLSTAWDIPQTKVCRVTVTVPGMPEPYDSRTYQLPDTLPEDAARVLALAYYEMETTGAGFTTDALPNNPDYIKVTSGVRFDTFSGLESWLESVYTPEAVSAMLGGQRTDPYYKEGPADELWIQGYAFDHIIPQSGLTCTEPQEQPDGSLQFAAVCVCVTDDEGKLLAEGQGRLYYAPVCLVQTANGWRVDEAEVPF